MNNLYLLRCSIFHNQLCLAMGSGSQKHTIDSMGLLISLPKITHPPLGLTNCYTFSRTQSIYIVFQSPSLPPQGWIQWPHSSWCQRLSQKSSKSTWWSSFLSASPIVTWVPHGQDYASLRLDVLNNEHVENIRNICWSNVWLNKHIKEARRKKGQEGLRE